MKLVAGDYHSLEVRVAAAVSHDPNLLAIVNGDPSTPEGDLHAQTMRQVFGIPFAEWKHHPAIRVAAKVYFFARLYGGKEYTIRERLEQTALERPDLDIRVPTLSEARHNLAQVSATYGTYFNEWVPFAIYKAREEDNCTSYTIFGRPRLLPNLRASGKQDREAAERECISHIVQGTASDIARFATLRVNELPYGELILQVHDELVCRVDEAHLEWYTERMRYAMLLDQPLDGVPLVVDIGVGDDWQSTHK